MKPDFLSLQLPQFAIQFRRVFLNDPYSVIIRLKRKIRERFVADDVHCSDKNRSCRTQFFPAGTCPQEEPQKHERSDVSQEACFGQAKELRLMIV